MEAAPGIHRLGSSVVNFYLIGQGGRFTVVDAGAPKHVGRLIAALERLGHSLADVDAVLLTHAHADHMGIAEHVRTAAPATVHVHEDDAGYAQGEPLPGRDGKMAGYLWRPALWKTMVSLGKDGVSKVPPVVEVRSFSDGETIDVPGRPRAVTTPGHTPGSAVIALEDRRVLLSGDALVTWNPLTGRRGPQVMPSAFNHDTATALDSLGRLAGLTADIILPGHGEPWSGSPAEAARAAVTAGRS